MEEKLLQNEQPHTITPRPMPRPSHPGTSSSSSSSSASPETKESLSPVPRTVSPLADTVTPLADTVIARDDEENSEDEEYNDETIRKLLARGTKLQREMDRAQQERPVLSVPDDENDDEVSSSSSSDDLITTLQMSTLPSNVLPLANLLEDISERLVHVYAVKITISHLLLIQEFSSRRNRIHVRYDLPSSEPSSSDTATIVMPSNKPDDDDEDTTASRVPIEHQRVFPLLFTQEMAELWQRTSNGPGIINRYIYKSIK